MKVQTSTQLYIQTADKPGELAKVLHLAAKAKINVLGCAGYSRDGQGRIMLLTKKNDKLEALLKKAGYKTRQDPVVIVSGKDAVGRGAKIAERVAKAKINLTGMYAVGAGGRYLLVLQAENVAKLAAALKK